MLSALVLAGVLLFCEALEVQQCEDQSWLLPGRALSLASAAGDP